MHIYTIFLLVLSFGAGYAPSIRSLPSLKTLWPGVHTEVLSKEFTLNSKDGSIEVDNLQGSITISGWDKDTVLVKTTKIGSEEQLKDTKINIHSTSSSLSLCTHATITNQEPAEVEYVINVPEKATLTKISSNKGSIKIKDIFGKISVSALHGDVFIRNVRDTLEVRTSKGSIDLKQKTLTSRNSMLLETMQGNITLHLPPGINAKINAKASAGTVTSEHLIALDSQTVLLNKETWNQFKREAIGTIGEGGPAIIIDVNKGNIVLKKESNT